MTDLVRSPVKPALLDQATRLLLAPAALEFGQLSDVLAGIHGHRIDNADLYFQYSRVESWSLEEGIVKSGSFSIDRGVGVRAISGEKTAFAYSDDISLDALTQAATATRAIGRQGQSAVAALDRIGGARTLYSANDPVTALTDEAKVALLERLERLARARDPRITQVMASLAGEYEAILVARSDGSIAADVTAAGPDFTQRDRRAERPSRAGNGRWRRAASTTGSSPTRCSNPTRRRRSIRR